jgi:hypothetical protein
MKKLVLFLSIVSSLVFISSCAKKGCTDKSAPNYNSSATKDDGSCTDLTTNIVGTYSGSVQDSTTNGGGASITYPSQTVIVTKIDDSHVSVASSSGSVLNAFTATVSQAPNGYWLVIASQNNGTITIAGAPTDAQGHNGAYVNVNGTRAFSCATTYTSPTTGYTVLEYFVGVHQ